MDHPSPCGLSRPQLLSLLRRRPQALAQLAGGPDHPALSGTVRFYQTGRGVLVYAEVRGLPYSDLPCQGRVFGFHIHSGTGCTGNADDPFADALSHFDPDGCEHPYHAGDLPPLFGNHGFALSLFLTDRFTVEGVLGRTVILHDHPDDLTTQPSGGSGAKIACGVIKRVPSSRNLT